MDRDNIRMIANSDAQAGVAMARRGRIYPGALKSRAPKGGRADLDPDLGILMNGRMFG